MSGTDGRPGETPADEERAVEPATDERDPAADAPLVETAQDATDESGPPVIEVDAERRV